VVVIDMSEMQLMALMLIVAAVLIFVAFAFGVFVGAERTRTRLERLISGELRR
jgi:ABC-type Na+ efflux pump permease subunit